MFEFSNGISKIRTCFKFCNVWMITDVFDHDRPYTLFVFDAFGSIVSAVSIDLFIVIFTLQRLDVRVDPSCPDKTVYYNVIKYYIIHDIILYPGTW